MADSQPVSSNIPKRYFHNINFKLSAYNKKNQKNIWNSVFKWNYDHHFIKNLLKLINKTLKGLNKYHVFRINYIYTFIGMGLGFLATQLQNKIQKLQNLQYKPDIVDIIKQKILRNQTIRIKLQETVNSNVLRNQDIQTNLHYVLINKVLLPEKQKLPLLVKQALIGLIKSQEIFNLTQKITIQAIQMNKQFIAKQALNFLGGELMLGIIRNNVAPLINGQTVQQVVSRQLLKLAKIQLQKQQNMQKGYEFIRQKII